jgi:hypothetical protein
MSWTKANIEILVDRIKSPEEAVKTLLAGAHHLTCCKRSQFTNSLRKLWMNLPTTGGELVIRFCNTENFLNSGASIIPSLTAYKFGYFVCCGQHLLIKMALMNSKL